MRHCSTVPSSKFYVQEDLAKKSQSHQRPSPVHLFQNTIDDHGSSPVPSASFHGSNYTNQEKGLLHWIFMGKFTRNTQNGKNPWCPGSIFPTKPIQLTDAMGSTAPSPSPGSRSSKKMSLPWHPSPHRGHPNREVSPWSVSQRSSTVAWLMAIP